MESIHILTDNFSEGWKKFWCLIWDFIYNKWIGSMTDFSDAEAGIKSVLAIIGTVLGFFIIYRALYFVVGLFSKPVTYPETEVQKKYCFVVAARNEECVIENTVNSILDVDYPRELFDVIVIADNCTDDTAKVAANAAARVVEHNDNTKRRKGYALEYLFDQLIAENKLHDYDAYIIIDADNLLRKDFLTEMNKGFVYHKDVCCAYRSCKNFDTNFISASYGIHFYGSTMNAHRPRAKFKVGTSLNGTGMCIGTHLLENGWHYTLITEDAECFCDLVSKGYKVGFVENAILYDEHPTSFSVSWTQRIRWTYGRLVCFLRYHRKAFKTLFKEPSFTKYDGYWHMFPYELFTLIISLLTTFTSIVFAVINHNPSILLTLLKGFGMLLLTSYLSNLLLGIIFVIREHTRINCGFFKTILYLLLFPYFYMIGPILILLALCKRNLDWKTIPHKDTRDGSQLAK